MVRTSIRWVSIVTFLTIGILFYISVAASPPTQLRVELPDPQHRTGLLARSVEDIRFEIAEKIAVQCSGNRMEPAKFGWEQADIFVKEMQARQK